MKVNGRTLSEHLRLLKPFFWVLALVWALRYVVALAGGPTWLVRSFSLIFLAPILIAVMVLVVHIRRFGGYSNVIVATFLLTFFVHLLIASGILLTETMGIERVMRPSVRHAPPTLTHAIGHLTFGLGMGTILGAALASILLFVLRMVVPKDRSRQYE